MQIKPQLDPVGQVINIPGLDTLIAKMKQVWDSIKAELGTVNWASVVQFLTQALDSLINFLVEQGIPGADKKATVLNAISNLWDYVVNPLIPFWVRPFAGVIKNFVINVIISNAIDWIVAKYQSGAWKPQTTQAVLAAWGIK